MSVQPFRLTATKSQVVINLTFDAVAMSIENPTASPVYIRLGATDFPNESNADRVIPAAQSRVIAVEGRVFTAVLGSPTQLTTGATPVGGLTSTVVVTLLSKGETVPTFGSASFLSISTAQLSSGFQAIVPTAQVYDLGPWGGAIIFLAPDGGSGQAIIDLQVSNDSITWATAQQYAMWPGLPVTVNVPRVMRYLKMTVFATGIVGEPNPSGSFYVRGSITEITQYTYKPTGTPITKTYNLAPAGAVQYQIYAGGIPAISVAIVALSGSGVGASITLLIEASSDKLNWRQVTFRQQTMSIGKTAYRTTGQLDLYVRISVSEFSGANSAVGTIYISTTDEPDLAAILNTIQQSIGDKDAPSNTNQDVYHELDTIRQSNASILTQLTAINTLETANLPYLSNLPNIKLDTASIVTQVTQIAKQTLNPVQQSTVVGAGAWVSTGIDATVGARITYIQMSELIVAANAMGFLQMAIGTNAGPTFILFLQRPNHYWNAAVGTTTLVSEALTFQDGWTVLNGFTRIWVQSSVAGTIDWTMLLKG